VSPPKSLLDYYHEFARQEAGLREGGGPDGVARQHKLGRLVVRERIAALADDQGGSFLELGLWAAHGMYQEWGNFPGAGVVTGIADISGRPCMIVANDATVKAGAWFPLTGKKNLRAQEIAMENHLPLIYLVDSAGVFLPMQDEIFPDEEHFGRIFRNNAVISSMGIPQIAAIMGPCVAGGAYLPIMSDESMIVDGTGSVFLAGSYLVKSAIGEDIDNEALGGATTHSEISGVTDYKMPNDKAALDRIRSLIAKMGQGPTTKFARTQAKLPKLNPDELLGVVPRDRAKPYDTYQVIDRIIDADSWDEYKAGYGKTIITGYAYIDGWAVGLVANQRALVKAGKGEMQIGGVIYSDSADKAARFIMNCNQKRIPLVFLQDVTGFMVGKDAEQSGIIRSGAKMVSALSNSTVPKVTVITGGSYGAGNYAMCGKAFDPRFIFAWPNARYAVMGAAQASDVVYNILAKAAKDRPKEELDRLRQQVKENYVEQADIRYAAARGWIDAVIQPHNTRATLLRAFALSARPAAKAAFHTGVLQV
jgi:3-methylcrotonyl-CoA carboxylase beta subunit